MNKIIALYYVNSYFNMCPQHCEISDMIADFKGFKQNFSQSEIPRIFNDPQAGWEGGVMDVTISDQVCEGVNQPASDRFVKLGWVKAANNHSVSTCVKELSRFTLGGRSSVSF